MMIMGIFFETPTLLELEYFMENNQPNHNYQAIIIINIEYETRAVAVRWNLNNYNNIVHNVIYIHIKYVAIYNYGVEYQGKYGVRYGYRISVI